MRSWRNLKKGIFLVNLLAIVYNPKNKMILIGRREKDPYIKKLTWCFPGGRPDYKKDLETSLKYEVKKKTNLDVEVKKILFARTYPEKRSFLSIYYLAIPRNVGKERAGGNFKEIKWIKPTEVKNILLHHYIHRYLKS